MDAQTLGLALAWYLTFIFSTSFHEAAHAFVALKLGDPTAYHGGQVSLNPLSHMRREPFGMILAPIFSFFLFGWTLGWASVPYDPVWADRYPRRAAWMSLAGPAANLILILVAALAIHLGLFLGVFYAPESIRHDDVTLAVADAPAIARALATVVSILFTLNLILMVFNLLPLPPLDGSGALPLLLKGPALRGYQDIMRQPGVSLIGLIVAWNLFKYLFRPIHALALNLLYPGSGYQ